MFTAVALVIALAAGAIGVFFIQKEEAAVQKRMENAMGAVAEEYPGAENTFIGAMNDDSFSHKKDGAEIFASYGYDEGSVPGQDGRLIFMYIAAVTVMLAAALAFGYAMLAYVKKRRREQNATLLRVVEQCLSEDFSFISDSELMEKAGDSGFADSLMKLAQAMEIKTRKFNEEHDNTKTLVTDISHQLKTPISAMKACFDMYREAETKEERDEFAYRAKIQVDKLESLAASLVNISRLESRMITPEPEKIPLTDILVGAVNTVYHKAMQKKIEIETEELDDVTVYADRKWTTEAVANVLDNGIKYSPEGSVITIRAERLFSFVRVEIEDRGIGIPKEERNRIFARFYRGSSDAVKEQEGSGVGLYLTRRILEEQGGTVSVRSESGEGSTFVIQLPLG